MNKKRIVIAFVFLCVAVLLLVIDLPTQKHYLEESGLAFGTIYHITYENVENKSLQKNVDSLLLQVDASLSMFNQNSVIAKINRNDSVVVDSFFVAVFEKAEAVSRISDGAFDITVAPLVNAWGFGFKTPQEVSQNTIDSLLQLVDYHKVALTDGKIQKADARIQLDASAIAKGFGSDVVAHYFDQCGIDNYMVEIGGEVVAKGVNKTGHAWRIGINKPVDDSTSLQNDIQEIIELRSGGLATSGNYRNFYIKNGKKYAHTINPKTGFPIDHNLLSATIIAKDCVTADAFATACMVLGLDKSLQLCESYPDIDGFFVYGDGDSFLTAYSNGFEKYMIKK